MTIKLIVLLRISFNLEINIPVVTIIIIKALIIGRIIITTTEVIIAIVIITLMIMTNRKNNMEKKENLTRTRNWSGKYAVTRLQAVHGKMLKRTTEKSKWF